MVLIWFWLFYFFFLFLFRFFSYKDIFKINILYFKDFVLSLAKKRKKKTADGNLMWLISLDTRLLCFLVSGWERRDPHVAKKCPGSVTQKMYTVVQWNYVCSSEGRFISSQKQFLKMTPQENRCWHCNIKNSPKSLFFLLLYLSHLTSKGIKSVKWTTLDCLLFKFFFSTQTDVYWTHVVKLGYGHIFLPSPCNPMGKKKQSLFCNLFAISKDI